MAVTVDQVKAELVKHFPNAELFLFQDEKSHDVSGYVIDETFAQVPDAYRDRTLRHLLQMAFGNDMEGLGGITPATEAEFKKMTGRD